MNNNWQKYQFILLLLKNKYIKTLSKQCYSLYNFVRHLVRSYIILFSPLTTKVLNCDSLQKKTPTIEWTVLEGIYVSSLLFFYFFFPQQLFCNNGILSPNETGSRMLDCNQVHSFKLSLKVCLFYFLKQNILFWNASQ